MSIECRVSCRKATTASYSSQEVLCSQSRYLRVLVAYIYRAKERVYAVPESPGLKKPSKGAARRNCASVARQAVRDSKIHERVLSI